VESSLEGERQKSGQYWAVEPALPLEYDARYTNRTEDARKRTFVGWTVLQSRDTPVLCRGQWVCGVKPPLTRMNREWGHSVMIVTTGFRDNAQGWWRQYVSPKRRSTSTGLNGAISHKAGCHMEFTHGKLHEAKEIDTMYLSLVWKAQGVWDAQGM
jgi:hypothetical protein